MTDSPKNVTGPQAFDKALAHIREHGWAQYERDRAMANRLYESWLIDTEHSWKSSGVRDSKPLYENLLETLQRLYGECDGDARWCMLSVMLEIRARDEGQNQRRLHC